AMARGEIIGAAKLRQHARRCLRCQAEMSRERRIQRELQSLRSEIPVPNGLMDRILESVDTIDRTPFIARRQRSKVAALCGLGIALALGLSSLPARRRSAQAS
ncbi:MAG: hypothetical protein VX760_08355, partial [Actinomycetota bacterium]|nr:hypothetical protein [Actinomycetota bacterium]